MGEAYLDIIVRIEKAQADIKAVKDDMAKLGVKSEEINKNIRQEFDNTGNVASKLRPLIAGIFSIAAITGFIKKLIEVRSELEKQSAIIKTVTGSQYQANETMKDLRSLADLSSESMKSLSNAYIRLANQGIKPTLDQMKKMMDVAVSSNRGFEQLAEAIFDAVNQQTRGLKDFRINSKIEGDKIVLSFKGMTETVDLTAEAITGFVLKIAELPGIAGATEEVAKTMSGAVNDIGDAWEHFFDDTSKASEGFLRNLLKVVTGTVNILDVLVKSGLSFKQREKEQIIIDDLLYAFDKIKAETIDVTVEEIKQAGAIELVIKQIEILKKSIPGLSEKELPAAQLALYNLNQELKRLTELGIETPDIDIEKIKSISDVIMTSMENLRIPMADTVKEYGYMWEQIVATAQRKAEEEEQIFRDKARAETEIEQLKAESIMQIAEGVGTMFMQGKEDELKAAGDSAEMKEQIERKYANRAKIFSISMALIQGLLAMQKNRAELGTIFAAPVNLWQAILTAATMATIAAQKFAGGVLDLKGPGTGTSDSIPSMLSRGESVMTAKETKEFYPYLKSMKEGKFPKLQMELMNDFAKLQGVTNNNLNYDNSKEIKELRAIRKALDKNYSETIEGRFKVVRRGNTTTKISLN